MPICCRFIGKTPAALSAHIGLFPQVVIHVSFKVGLLYESFPTGIAVMPKSALMSAHVTFISLCRIEGLLAKTAVWAMIPMVLWYSCFGVQPRLEKLVTYILRNYKKKYLYYSFRAGGIPIFITNTVPTCKYAWAVLQQNNCIHVVQTENKV